jgi:tetratricopeptide (TPR) repeat protein
MDKAPTATPVGQRIRARRLELGLSQAEIAEGMLSPSYVSLVESGRRQPAASALAHIAERLRIDVEFLRDGVDASVRTRARLALGRAEKALYDGRTDEAYDAFTALIGDPGLNDEQSRKARLGRALVLERQGALEQALESLAELAEEARQSPELQPWTDIALAMTRCYREVGDLDMAIQIGEEAMRSAADLGLESTDDYVRLGCTVLSAYYVRGDVVRSKALASNLLWIADTMGAPHTRGAVYWNASIIAEARGDLAEALSLVDRALALFGESDDQRNLVRLRTAYAWMLMQGPEPRAGEALDLLERVQKEVTTHGSSIDVAYHNVETARALLALGRLDEAAQSVDRALAGLGDQPRLETANARLLLAQVLNAQGNTHDSIREASGAAASLAAMGATRQAAAAWRQLADLYRDLGKTDEALEAYDHALRLVHVGPTTALGLVDATHVGAVPIA